jgi:tetratricopeptide (TPR) repeat protein
MKYRLVLGSIVAVALNFAQESPKIAKPNPTAKAALTLSKPKGPASPTIEIPEELRSKVSIAGQHARSNQIAEALALYSEVLSGSPNLFTVAFERGKLHQQAKDYPKAIADFTTAINFRPMEYFEAYFRRCIVYYETGDHTKSITDCSKAIEINPTVAEYYYYRGLAYTALRTWDKAAADLTAANELNNDNADAHLQLARIYLQMDQLIGSLREYTVALQKRPGLSEAYKGRSIVKAALGDAIGSQEDLAKAAE